MLFSRSQQLDLLHSRAIKRKYLCSIERKRQTSLSPEFFAASKFTFPTKKKLGKFEGRGLRKGSLLAIFCCWILTTIASYPAWAQTDNDPPQANQQQELPKHAVWRRGPYQDERDKQGIYRIVASPDGTMIATRDIDNLIKITDAKTGDAICEFEGHGNRVETLDFSPDSKMLLTAAGAGEKIKIWEARTGQLEATIDTIGSAAFFNAAGTRINILGEKHVETYSWPEAQMVDQKKWKSSIEITRGMTRNGRWIIMYRKKGRNAYQTLLLNLETRTKIPLDLAPISSIKSVKFSQDQNWAVASYNRESKAQLWDLRNPTLRSFALAGHESSVQSLAFSPDSRFLVTTSWDDTAILWDVLTQTAISRFKGHKENVTAVTFLPGGFRFVTGASGRKDCSTICWDYSKFAIADSSDVAGDDFQPIWDTFKSTKFPIAMVGVSKIANSKDKLLASVVKHIEASTSNRKSNSVADLIADLQDDDYEVRENATIRLIKIRVTAEAQIKLALENAKFPEVKSRLRRVLRNVVRRIPRNYILERQWSRLIFALEQMASPQGKTLLQNIANGHKNSEVANEAQLAWERLERKSSSDN